MLVKKGEFPKNEHLFDILFINFDPVNRFQNSKTIFQGLSFGTHTGKRNLYDNLGLYHGSLKGTQNINIFQKIKKMVLNRQFF